MRLHLPLDGTGPLRQRLYRDLREALKQGRLKFGEKLPPSRELAESLGIGRKTVVEAYEQLTAEGFFMARSGSGTFVCRLPPADEPEPPVPGPGPGSHWRPLPAWVGQEAPRRFNFAGGVTDRRWLPHEEWRRALLQALRDDARDTRLYGDPCGDQDLRRAIAHYLAYSRGLPCAADDILVTQGAQQGLDLLARVRIAPGDTVAVEEPGYPPARAVLEARGARVVGVPVDDQGLRVDRLPSPVSLIYVTPSHQFPLGMPMGLERRLELLAFARRNRALVVEDDYDGEFRFEGRALDALKSLDRNQQVAYLGSFSKVLHADLRVGYMVMPLGLAAALRQAKVFNDGYSPVLTQRALALLMESGAFARHLRRMQRLYLRRRHRLITALEAARAPWTVLPQVAGLHLAVRFNQPVDGLAEKLAEAEIGALDLGMFHHPARQGSGVLLGLGMIDEASIEAGVDALAGCL
ncbi:MAG TPA: PLP-dependent aminotransferase family protein [Alcanivorax sp.]|nr:PLP-dependent aminotransferase family protein [Alcanivorax sp.]